jgi:inner membrane protein
VDNVTHTLCGLALARTGAGRAPLATAALVIGANLPDADVLLAPVIGQTGQLIHHRGLTHSVAGLAIEAVLLAAVLSRGRRFLPLLAAAALGLASHLGLDFLNTYGVRPWLPLRDARFYGDAAFIVDPWLWLGFGAAACLGGERRLPYPWATFAAVALGFMVMTGHPIVALVWAVGAALVALAWRLEVGRAWATWVSLGATALYLAGLLASSHLAATRGLAAIEPLLLPGERVESSSASPEPAVPWRFSVLVETQGRILVVPVDAGRPGPVFTRANGLDDRDLPRIAGTEEYRAWRIFARHPFVGRLPGALLLGDARYGLAAEPSWCNLVVPLGP